MTDGLIADIQRASVHDGSGIRTTVFFKGCPLNCAWCHNPECISFEPQMMYYPEKCIHCGMCEKGCYSGARVLCGKKMTAQQIADEVILDKEYYADNGGVTFSGGEPMAQKAFLSEAIDKCKIYSISCAIETSLIYFDESIFKKLDFIMADLKIWSNELHKQHTGVGNEAIKEHFRMLNTLNVPIIARTPVIPGINQEIDKISGFLKKLHNVTQYELLPYHPLGTAKQRALGAEAMKFEIPSKEYIKELNKYVYIR